VLARVRSSAPPPSARRTPWPRGRLGNGRPVRLIGGRVLGRRDLLDDTPSPSSGECDSLGGSKTPEVAICRGDVAVAEEVTDVNRRSPLLDQLVGVGVPQSVRVDSGVGLRGTPYDPPDGPATRVQPRPSTLAAGAAGTRLLPTRPWSARCGGVSRGGPRCDSGRARARRTSTRLVAEARRCSLANTRVTLDTSTFLT
jgi:hypothetical protein